MHGERVGLTVSIQQAFVPLRCIFWGGLLCVLDFRISEVTHISGGAPEGWQFDVLSDLVGMILITGGVTHLRRFDVGGSYRPEMTFVLVMAIYGAVEAANAHLIPPPVSLFGFLANLSFPAFLVASLVFPRNMVRLSAAHGLTASMESWRRTTLLMGILFVGPLSLLYLVGLFGPVHIGGAWAVGILGGMMVPIVHLFVSTSRMKREVGGVGHGHGHGHGPEREMARG